MRAKLAQFVHNRNVRVVCILIRSDYVQIIEDVIGTVIYSIIYLS